MTTSNTFAVETVMPDRRLMETYRTDELKSYQQSLIPEMIECQGGFAHNLFKMIEDIIYHRSLGHADRGNQADAWVRAKAAAVFSEDSAPNHR